MTHSPRTPPDVARARPAARWLRLAAMALVASTSLLDGTAGVSSAQSAAQPHTAHDAQEAPLRGFRPADLRRIEPLLAHGTVGLVELTQGDLLPAIHLATIVRAPAATIAGVISHPESYPTFMPAVSEVTLRERSGGVTGFAWRWQTSVFQLGGEAMITTYAPPAAHPERGYRVSMERLEGDLGRGREMWRVIPRGRGESLVLLSTRVDLRDSSAFARQVQRGIQSLNRSINLAMGFAALLQTQAEAERRAGFTRPPVVRELRRPDVNLDAFDALLRRGDMLLVETNGVELRQASVISRLEQPEDHVRRIMLDPIAFSQALVAGSHAEVTERNNERVAFRWGNDTPLIGTSGSMTLGEQEDRTIALDATGGAMEGGQWRFVTQRLRSGATAVLGWAQFDIGSANFLLRAIVDADAGFRPGLSAATEIMMARALRIRVQYR